VETNTWQLRLPVNGETNVTKFIQIQKVNAGSFLWKVFFSGAMLAGTACSLTQAQPAPPAQRNCVYANDNFSTANTVDGYMVVEGAATYLPPVATGGNGSAENEHTFFATRMVAIAPGTTHLYASNNGTSDIAMFNIDAASCRLTRAANYASGGDDALGMGLAISPAGKFLYASNGTSANTITVLKINSDGGLSSPVQTVSVPATQTDMAVTPDGKTLITTQPGVSNQVSAYRINAANGKLTLASALTVNGAAGLSIDAHSRFIYVGEGGGSAQVQVLELTAGGKLVLVDEFAIKGADGARGIGRSSNCTMLSPSGKLLYFTNQVGATVTTLNVIPQTGEISFNRAVQDGETLVDEPSQMATDPSGSLIFTGDFNTNGAPSLGILKASADGGLTLLGNFPLAQNAAATSIVSTSF
jgi:6-phosphogluconolactonase (cycloisomerase 2 family)